MHRRTLLSRGALEYYLAAACVALIVLNVALKIGAIVLVQRTQSQDVHAHPETGWSVPLASGEVALDTGAWTRYTLHDPEPWAPLFPGGGVVHLGPSRAPYTVAMMHQLRCMDALRHEFTRPRVERDWAVAQHCLNYLRQAARCRGDTHLDGYQYASKPRAVDTNPVRRCRDWRAVYEKVEQIQREHALWMQEHDTAREEGPRRVP
ncbi:uncharacterized protein BXZ73DRAFT_46104 [Epithele typhae]|uniref:uncharacterized protein n=1 Tax=Epithele typhae TaxID=378194 RepID=UPI002007577B|nr:uncharacterized protein BXZ73DRAFT_46104 [Epithele typhae]KAH9934037.1 hypothetical protein BXZ73DRAFT_46104 [Epithele typhae]